MEQFKVLLWPSSTFTSVMFSAWTRPRSTGRMIQSRSMISYDRRWLSETSRCSDLKLLLPSPEKKSWLPVSWGNGDIELQTTNTQSESDAHQQEVRTVHPVCSRKLWDGLIGWNRFSGVFRSDSWRLNSPEDTEENYSTYYSTIKTQNLKTPKQSLSSFICLLCNWT